MHQCVYVNICLGKWVPKTFRRLVLDLQVEVWKEKGTLPSSAAFLFVYWALIEKNKWILNSGYYSLSSWVCQRVFVNKYKTDILTFNKTCTFTYIIVFWQKWCLRYLCNFLRDEIQVLFSPFNKLFSSWTSVCGWTIIALHPTLELTLCCEFVIFNFCVYKKIAYHYHTILLSC